MLHHFDDSVGDLCRQTLFEVDNSIYLAQSHSHTYHGNNNNNLLRYLFGVGKFYNPLNGIYGERNCVHCNRTSAATRSAAAHWSQ